MLFIALVPIVMFVELVAFSVIGRIWSSDKDSNRRLPDDVELILEIEFCREQDVVLPLLFRVLSDPLKELWDMVFGSDPQDKEKDKQRGLLDSKQSEWS